MTTRHDGIRTPDQRIRIFVSSTLQELSPERKAVREAIERLHLAPVMFELGARPHPPRDLYRAYLEQSDVFVGLYWERYGWVAPTEQISGLEDEWVLSSGMPRLLYIKEPSEERDPRLSELIGQMELDDRASYTAFSTPDQLRTLVEEDLATLLAERFDLSRAARPPAVEETPGGRAFPVPLTTLIGRELESQQVREMLARDDVRLLTLTGPGGIGKSRLALDAVQSLATASADPPVFVDLAPISDPDLVPTAIAQAIGVRDTGDEPLIDKLAVALRRRDGIVLIDNFEQVVDAADVLTRLLAAAPALTFLITSRSLLKVAGEHAFEVGPLALPPADTGSVPRIGDASAVALFVERARAVKPDFDLTDGNARSVAAICEALDGVPLAIELAAARARIFAPGAMLSRLDRRLPLLVGGRRDGPPRQRTLRDTIQWSSQLLGDDERRLLARLGVFVGAFTLDAVEKIAGVEGDDVLSCLEALVDSSLVRETDHGDRAWFSTLATVREFALDQLDADELERLRLRHAQHYLDLGDALELALEDRRQRAEIAGLTLDRDNLRATVRYFLDHGDHGSAAQIAWTLHIYWWLAGHLGELRGWMEEVLEADAALDDFTRAVALYFVHGVSLWQARGDVVIPRISESVELFRRAGEKSGEGLALVSLALALLSAESPDVDAASGSLERSLELFRDNDDPWGESMALVTMGRLAILGEQLPRARELVEETLSITERQGDEFGTTIALHHLGWTHFLLGDLESAASAFRRSVAESARIGNIEGIAYGLEGIVAVDASEGEVEQAGLLLGASDRLREQVGIAEAPNFSFHARLLAPLVNGSDAPGIEEDRRRGRELTASDAVALVMA